MLRLIINGRWARQRKQINTRDKRNNNNHKDRSGTLSKIFSKAECYREWKSRKELKKKKKKKLTQRESNANRRLKRVSRVLVVIFKNYRFVIVSTIIIRLALSIIIIASELLEEGGSRDPSEKRGVEGNKG